LTDKMQKVLFAAVLVLGVSYGMAFECFSCADAGECAKFDNPNEVKKMSEQNGRPCQTCTKIMTKDSNRVSRSCVSVEVPDEMKTEGDVTTYFCTQELCNGASQVTISFTTAALLYLVGKLLW